MTPSYTSKSRGRYRYYVSQALLQYRKHDAGRIPRVPAQAIEKSVETTLISLLTNDARLHHIDGATGASRIILSDFLERVEIAPEALTLKFRAKVVSQYIDKSRLRDFQTTEGDVVSIPVKISLRGGERHILKADGTRDGGGFQPDHALIKALARAWRWRKMLESAKAQSLTDLCKSDGVGQRYVEKIIKLGFLAPDITEAILSGSQPPDLTLKRLMRIQIPHSWVEQRQLFGFAS